MDFTPDKPKKDEDLERQQREAREQAERDKKEEEARMAEEEKARGSNLRGFRALLGKGGWSGFRNIMRPGTDG